MSKTPSKNQDANSRSATSRRAVLTSAAVAGLMLPFVRNASAVTSGHHDHHTKHQELIDLALTCVGRGEVCAKHCIDVLGTGDTSLKDCLISVNEMIPMCNTLSRFAALEAKRLEQLAKVCIDVCNDCAKECEKHAEEHEECKVCGEACVDIVKACEALIAA